MRTTKNSKKIALNYVNPTKLEKINNKKIFSPGKIVVTTLNNKNIQIEQNDYSEEGLIKNLNDNKEFNEEEEFNLDMISQKYMNNNIKEEEEDEENSIEEKNKEEYNYDEENIDNNNNEFNNNIEYINNKYINDIDNNNNNNENFDYKEYVYQNMENLENDDENNKNEEENNEKEKDEEEENYELNEKYNLPLSINYNKKKIKIEEKLNNNNEKKEEENLEYKKSENEIDEIFNVEKNIEENQNDNEDINNKYENEDNNNEDNMKENENRKEINYEDYILNALSKLKKNKSLKLEKEDKNELIQQYNNTEPNNILEQKKKDNLFSVSSNINSNKTLNEDDFNIFKDNNSINLLPEINKVNKEEEKIIQEGIKFGIDETGNPLNISAFFEEGNKRKKLIAYIIQNNNISDNYLVDTKGNILQKSEEGDYLYKDNDTFVVIKDFDVKHPELRIFGHRSYIFGKKNKESLIKNKDIIDKKNKTDKIFEYDSLKVNEKYNNNFYNDDEIEKRLFNNNINKYNNIHSNTKGKDNFDELMSIWRERYGQKNNYKEIKYNNYSYNYEDRIIQRTNSILKMASEKLNKYDNNIKYNNIENKANSEINYIKKYPRLAISKKYNIPIYDKNILNKNYENPLLRKKGNSYSNKITKIMNNPLLKSKNLLENIGNDNNNKDIKYNKIEINTKNILNKKNSYKRNVETKNNLIKNKGDNIERNNLTYKRIDIKNNSVINNNIYNNITKINELNNKRRNKRYSILSNEANEVIKDYNISHKYILNKKNKTFTNENNINNFNFVSIRNKNSFSINLNNNNDKNYYKIKRELNNKFNNKMKSFSFSKLYEANNNIIKVNKRIMNNRDNDNNFHKKKRYNI